MNIQKSIVFLTLLIEVLGISIIIPAFPELKTYYGIGDFQVTIALSVYSLFAFLAAPILGQLSDQIGRKRPLSWCILGTALSYFVMLVSPVYRIFLIGRAINGITGGNISIIQAILTDMSPDQSTKNKNFGLMGAFFGLGFIIGPFLGSLMLTRGGVEAIFWFGGILASLQFLLLRYMFHNTNTLIPTKQFQYNPLRTIHKFIIRPQLRPWLFSFLCIGIGMFIVNAGQALYMYDVFNTPGIRYGYYLSVLGVISAINMAILVPKFWTKYFSTKQLLYRCFAIMIVGYFIVSMMANELSYIMVFYSMMFLGGAFRIVYNVQIMSQAKAGEVGEISGMFGSLQSLTMVIGPLFAGILLQSTFNIHRGAMLFFIIAFLIMFSYLTTKNTSTI